jgi:hypothetical protein
MKQIRAAGEIRLPYAADRLHGGSRSWRFKVQHLLFHTAPMLLVILLAVCLAVANVLYFPVSPGAAAVAVGATVVPAPASTAATLRGHAQESNRR